MKAIIERGAKEDTKQMNSFKVKVKELLMPQKVGQVHDGEICGRGVQEEVEERSWLEMEAEERAVSARIHRDEEQIEAMANLRSSASSAPSSANS